MNNWQNHSIDLSHLQKYKFIKIIQKEIIFQVLLTTLIAQFKIYYIDRNNAI
ncbi:hypothetical protein J2X61_002271 [Bacillus sp. 3255]|nr:hypothetical protein [Bacillus sp. 3255]